MGAAAIAGLALIMASQAGNSYANYQSTKAQQGEFNKEQQIQGQYNQKIGALDSAQMQRVAPGGPTGGLGGQAAAIAQSVNGGTAAPTAAAAAGASGGGGSGSSGGELSQATQGAASTAALRGNLLAQLQSPNRVLNADQVATGNWMMNRGRQQAFAQRQASTVYPWMLEAAAGKGASIASASNIAGTLGGALLGTGLSQKKTTSNTTAPGPTPANSSSPGAGDLLSDPNGSGYMAPNAPGYVDPQTGEEVAQA
jgi:hypothetical protein